MAKPPSIEFGSELTDVVCIDIETTHRGKGNKPPPQVIEVALVKLGMVSKMIDGEEYKVLATTEVFDSLVRPPDLQKWNRFNFCSDIHHITPNDVAGAPSLEGIAPTLIRLIAPSSIVVAHNCACEMWLFRNLARLGYAANVTFLDSYSLLRAIKKAVFTRDTWPVLRCSYQSALMGSFELDPHRALDDAIACARIYMTNRKFLAGLGFKKYRGLSRLNSDPTFRGSRSRMSKGFIRRVSFPARVTPSGSSSLPATAVSRVPVEERRFLLRTLGL